MNIDDLKTAWIELGARTDALEAREAKAVQSGAFSRARTRLRLLGAGLVVQTAIGVALAMLGGSFWFDHWGRTHLVIAGLAVHVYGVLLAGSAVAQIVAWHAIDFSGGVFDVQARVARLHRLRARAERALLVAGILLWVPAGLMLLAAVGLDLWTLSPAYVLANVAVAGVMAATLVGAMRRWPETFDRFVIGGSLKRAEDVLAELAE